VRPFLVYAAGWPLHEAVSRHPRQARIWKFAKRPDLAAQITLQPVEILDVDAADHLRRPAPARRADGIEAALRRGRRAGDRQSVRTSSDIDSLSISNTDELGYVGETIQMVVRALAGRVPGDRFRGRAFTMASYMIEGGPSRTFLRTKQMMYRDETLWRG